MMIAGPYRIPDIDIEALSVYTNRTPSGSVRAPTGPQACWAVEQHHDVLAARVGLDPVEFRWRNLVHDGDEGPTRQRHEGDGAHRHAGGRAVERIQAGEPLGPDEAIGVASGWWFSAPGPSGAFVRLESDGSGRIVTGAQENGTGRGDGAADPRRRGARDAARGLRDHLPGHRHRAVRRRQLRQPDDVQQRPGRRRGGARGPAPAARARGGRARGVGRRPGAARRPRRRRRQPGPAGLDRRARGDGPRRRAAPRPRLGDAARRARSTTRRPASAGSGSSRSPRRPSSATRPGSGSIPRPASSGP